MAGAWITLAMDDSQLSARALADTGRPIDMGTRADRPVLAAWIASRAYCSGMPYKALRLPGITLARN